MISRLYLLLEISSWGLSKKININTHQIRTDQLMKSQRITVLLAAVKPICSNKKRRHKNHPRGQRTPDQNHHQSRRQRKFSLKRARYHTSA